MSNHVAIVKIAELLVDDLLTVAKMVIQEPNKSFKRKETF